MFPNASTVPVDKVAREFAIPVDAPKNYVSWVGQPFPVDQKVNPDHVDPLPTTSTSNNDRHNATSHREKVDDDPEGNEATNTSSSKGVRHRRAAEVARDDENNRQDADKKQREDDDDRRRDSEDGQRPRGAGDDQKSGKKEPPAMEYKDLPIHYKSLGLPKDGRLEAQFKAAVVYRAGGYQRTYDFQLPVVRYGVLDVVLLCTNC